MPLVRCFSDASATLLPASVHVIAGRLPLLGGDERPALALVWQGEPEEIHGPVLGGRMKFVVEIGGERREVIGWSAVEYALANWEDYIASGRRKCESFTVTVHADGEDCDHESP